MEIYLEKFGKIKNANIKIDGLTLIAGKNDTGKSTVGKCLFALIKSIHNYNNLFENIIKRDIYSRMPSLIMELFKEYKIDDGLKQELNKFNGSMNSVLYLKESAGKIEFDDIKNIISLVRDFILKQETKNIVINKHIAEIEKLILEKEQTSDTDKLENILNKDVFWGTFFGSLNNSVHIKDKSVISYRQNNETSVIDLSVENNKFSIQKFNISNLIMSLKDVTFIDTPLFLEEGNSGNSSYAQDLLFKKNKLKLKFNEMISNGNTSILNEFMEVFGSSKFVCNNDQIKYKVENNSEDLMIHNIASGSKSFGLLYLLLKAGIITRESLLILDEPENHLHPEWQIKYAEIICKMVADGFYILITSHSPYFIQALRIYANKYGIIENKTEFYFAQETDKKNYSSIINLRDKDGNIEAEKIFESLYKPLEDLDNILL